MEFPFSLTEEQILSLIVVGTLAVVAIVGVNALAPKAGVAAPLVLVAVGVVVSFVPAVPEIEFEPEWILAGILPPLLYSAAVGLPTMDFRRDFTAISGLSVVLVLLSTALLGYLFTWLIPGIPLAAGFALGAIVSPTDAVATSIVKRLGASPRVVTLLEGEPAQRRVRSRAPALRHRRDRDRRRDRGVRHAGVAVVGRGRLRARRRRRRARRVPRRLPRPVRPAPPRQPCAEHRGVLRRAVPRLPAVGGARRVGPRRGRHRGPRHRQRRCEVPAPPAPARRGVELADRRAPARGHRLPPHGARAVRARHRRPGGARQPVARGRHRGARGRRHPRRALRVRRDAPALPRGARGGESMRGVIAGMQEKLDARFAADGTPVAPTVPAAAKPAPGTPERRGAEMVAKAPRSGWAGCGRRCVVVPPTSTT